MRGSIPSEEEQALKRLVAVVLAIALVCVPVAMGATASSSALEKQIASTPYQIWPAKARSNSPDFVRAAIKQRNAQGDNCKVVLGTSRVSLGLSRYGLVAPGELFREQQLWYGHVPFGPALLPRSVARH